MAKTQALGNEKLLRSLSEEKKKSGGFLVEKRGFPSRFGEAIKKCGGMNNVMGIPGTEGVR